jgi:hypothetical protein
MSTREVEQTTRTFTSIESIPGGSARTQRLAAQALRAAAEAVDRGVTITDQEAFERRLEEHGSPFDSYHFGSDPNHAWEGLTRQMHDFAGFTIESEAEGKGRAVDDRQTFEHLLGLGIAVAESVQPGQAGLLLGELSEIAAPLGYELKVSFQPVQIPELVS